VESEQRGERRATVRYDVAAPVLAAAWHAPAAGHPDAEALDVAGQILSAGRSSRLYRRLVYEEELALGAQGAYYEMRDAGLFYAWASVRPATPVDAAERLLFAEIARLREEPVSPAELEKARRGLELGLLQSLDTSHGLAFRIASDYVLLGRIRPLAERLAAIERVGADDVRRVARSYLVDERRSVVQVVPPQGAGS
jgi:zinc protease